jgi:hypothetical protein
MYSIFIVQFFNILIHRRNNKLLEIYTYKVDELKFEFQILFIMFDLAISVFLLIELGFVNIFIESIVQLVSQNNLSSILFFYGYF